MDTYNLQFLQSTEFRAFLGIAILICEFIIILFAMLYGVADTLRDIIRPLARLIPLGLFLLAIYRTFVPIFTSEDPVAYLTTAAADGTLTRTILFSLGTMLLFVLANRALGGETSKIKSLEAELAKHRRRG
jgi:hypothetical protein